MTRVHFSIQLHRRDSTKYINQLHNCRTTGIKECRHLQLENHVVETIAAVRLKETDDVRMLKTKAYTSLTFQIYNGKNL